MSQSGKVSQGNDSRPSGRPRRVESNQKQWFTTPNPIKRLFDKFPLRIYPPNELPYRGTRDGTQHQLYIFTTPEGANLGSPSYNPSCLKWQAYLKFTGIPFSNVSSNNHASPTGVLPFLIPSLTEVANEKERLPIPAAKLQRWALSETSRGRKKVDPTSRNSSNLKNTSSFEKNATAAEEVEDQNRQPVDSDERILGQEEPANIRYDAYLSLLDNKIRNTWLHFLYLDPSNFASVAKPLYINPCSSNSLVRASLAYDLRQAAKTELLKHMPIIDADNLYRASDKAFSALSHLLGTHSFFFAVDQPGLFDASVFAYTNPLLDDGLKWQETRLVRELRKYENLVEHRERILKRYF